MNCLRMNVQMKITEVAISFKFSGFNMETRIFYDFRNVFYDKLDKLH
jgi:hypothetical protein